MISITFSCAYFSSLLSPLINMAGISMYTLQFETEKPPVPPVFDPPKERKRRYKETMAKLHTERNELLASQWDPHNNPKATEYDSILQLYIILSGDGMRLR